MARTGYRDPKSVRDTASLYGVTIQSDPSFTPPRYIGVDFPNSFLRENIYWYSPDLYEYEGALACDRSARKSLISSVTS